MDWSELQSGVHDVASAIQTMATRGAGSIADAVVTEPGQFPPESIVTLMPELFGEGPTSSANPAAAAHRTWRWRSRDSTPTRSCSPVSVATSTAGSPAGNSIWPSSRRRPSRRLLARLEALLDIGPSEA